MKNLVLVLFILFAAQILTPAQTDNNLFHKGSWELNFTGSLGSIESSAEYSSSYFSGEESESRKYFELGITPAYYLIDALSIEPEINIFALEKSQPSFLFLGNLAYTFKIKNSNVYPFLRAGYGISNSIQIPVNRDISRMSNSLDIGILNLGGGIKVSLSESVLLRTELNYRKFTYTNDDSNIFYNSSYTYKLSSIALLLGFSILL